MPYFDHNATTPLSAIARDTWLRANQEHWHNPSSPYRDAAKARIRLDNARAQIAEFLGAEAESIVFTSGATESSRAVFNHLAAKARPETRIAISRAEHPAVREAAKLAFGSRILWLDTDAQGVVRPDAVGSVLARGDVAAVAVMAANNETGVVQPWPRIVELCQTAAVPYVCDASQWLGKLPASGLGGIDWTFGSGHKFGAPKGVGFLKCASSADGFRVQGGGEQEGGRRGGTENLPSIWAMTAALAEAEQKKVFLETERLRLRQDFERIVLAQIVGTRSAGSEAERLWNTVSLIMPQGENTRWVAKLDKLGFQLSTGSACATGKEGSSYVLSAMGFSPEEAKRTIRISSGWETSPKDWHALATALIETAKFFQADPENVVKL